MVDEDEYERLRRSKPPASGVGPILNPSLTRAKEDVSDLYKVRNMDVSDSDKADMYERLVTKYFSDLRSLAPPAKQTATPRARPDDPPPPTEPPREPEPTRMEPNVDRDTPGRRPRSRTTTGLKRETGRSGSRTPLTRPGVAHAFRPQTRTRRLSVTKPRVTTRQTRPKATLAETEKWEELKRTEQKKPKKRRV